MNDFDFIFWELQRRIPFTRIGGYPCIGYPQADKLVPAFKRVGAKFKIFEFCDYASLTVRDEDDEKDPFKRMRPQISSNKVLIEWDGITSHRDYKNIFKWNKEVYVIPHNGVIFGGYQTGDGEARIREEVTNKATKIIFQLEWERNWWKNLECDKFETIYPPTRIGTKFDKMESRKILGIKTKYAIICWGNYWNKNYEDMMPWIAEWKDTSLLFVGSGDEEKLSVMAKNHNILDNVIFSPHGISDVDADLWFSASDLCSYLRDAQGSSTPIHVVGQGKCMVTKNYPIYLEIEKLSGVVTSTDLKKTTRELLLDEEKRKMFEDKSIKYAQNNSYEQYAIKIGNIMGLSYSRR